MDRLRVIAVTQGVFLRSEARDLGYDDKAVGRALRAKTWVRVRHGAYTFSDLWHPLDAEGRHRILARAVMRSLGRNVALTHASAAIEHGLRVWGADLSRVHVTRLDGGAGRTEHDVVHHEGMCLDEDLVEKDGILLAKPPRAALETASLVSIEAGVVVLDSALHLKMATPDELAVTYELMQSWPATQHVQIGIRLADEGGQSVGESRARVLCWARGLPAPITQFEVFDDNGKLLGITDLAWPEHQLVGEFDGKVKYGRLLKAGETPGDAVFREKRREDLIREALRWEMVRLIWADLYRGAETAARIRRLMWRAA